MGNGFGAFLFNHKFKEMSTVNKNTFVMSDAFRKVLESSDCEISKKLLQLKSVENCPTWINYLDIAKDDASKISYVDEKRYDTYKGNSIKQEDLKEGMTFICVNGSEKYDGDAYGLTTVHGEEMRIVEIYDASSRIFYNHHTLLKAIDNYGNRWSIRYYDMDLAYDPVWNSKIRYMASCGKVINKLLGPQDGKEMSKFCELFSAHHPDFSFQVDFDLEFVKGKDIAHWYHEDQYYSESGSLGNSCMRYTKCQKFFGLYTENDIVSMFIVKDKETGKLMARTLIWNNKWFDRIYYIDSKIEAKVAKHLQSLGLKSCYDNEDVTITFDIDNGSDAFDFFPYCDTFRFLSKNQISNDSNIDWEIELDCPNGNNETCHSCEISGDTVIEDEDAVHVDGTGWVHERYTVFSNYDNQHYLEDDCVYCKYINDYILEYEAIQLYDENYTIDSRAIQLHDGDYADKDDPNLKELYDGQYALEDECEYSKLNNGYVLKDEAVFDEQRNDWVLNEQINEEELV